MTHLNDAELLDLVKNDHHIAFTTLYNRYQPLMLSMAKKKFSAEIEAEDIIQEIFISFWNRRKQIPLKVPVKYYLLRAVHLQYAQKCRSNVVVKKYNHFISYSYSNHNTQDQLINKEIGFQIREALEKISAPACRKIFELAYIEDKSYREIASHLNIQVQVARNQASRALKIIRKELTTAALF